MPTDPRHTESIAATLVAVLACTIAFVLGCGSGGGGDRTQGSDLAPASLDGGTLSFDNASSVIYEFGASDFTRSGPGGIGGVDGDMFEVTGTYTYSSTRGSQATLVLDESGAATVDGEPVTLPNTPPEILALTFTSSTDGERRGTALQSGTGSPRAFTLTGDLPGADPMSPPRGPITPPSDGPAPEDVEGRTITLTSPQLAGPLAVDFVSATSFTGTASFTMGITIPISGPYQYTKQDSDRADLDLDFTFQTVPPLPARTERNDYQIMLEFTSDDGGTAEFVLDFTVTLPNGDTTQDTLMFNGAFSISP